MKTKDLKKQKTKVNLLSFAIVTTITLLIYYSCSSGPEQNSSQKNNIMKISLAYTFSKEKVKEKLKSPGTAEFPSLSDIHRDIKELNDSTFLINAYVDSQNGFGAIVRSKYMCKSTVYRNNVVKVENITFF